MIIDTNQDFGISVGSLYSQCDTPGKSFLLKADFQLEIHMGDFHLI